MPNKSKRLLFWHAETKGLQVKASLVHFYKQLKADFGVEVGEIKQKNSFIQLFNTSS